MSFQTSAIVCKRRCLQTLLPPVVFGRLAEADTLKGTYAKNAFCCLRLEERCAAPLCKDGMRAQAVSLPANARANAVVRTATSLHIVALAGQRRDVFPTACVAPSVKRLVPAKKKLFLPAVFRKQKGRPTNTKAAQRRLSKIFSS